MKVRKDEIQKLHPKLRMIANGSETVNALRAELSSVVASTVTVEELVPPRRAVEKELAKPAVIRAPGNEKAFSSVLPRGKVKKLTKSTVARHAFVNVFVEVHRDRTAKARQDGLQRVQSLAEELRGDLEKARGAGEIDACVLPRRNMIATAIPVAKLTKLKDDPRVAFVQAAEGLTFRLPRADTRAKVPAAPSARRIGARDLHGDGEDAIIGIIDVGGFDFAHPDFLDPKSNGRTTRFLSIWDQGGNLHSPPARFGYGSEVTADHMNAAIAASRKKGGLPATMLDRQSQQVDGSHGTHVASIAAGNSGVCPKARIAAVLIDVPRQGDRLLERRATFSDSSRIVHAVEYLLAVADEQSRIKRKKVPISINISLGTNGGSHDGASGVSRWLDALLATEARSVCVAAGNAGQEGSTDPNDIGWITGRIHASGRVPSRGLDVDLEWTVVGDSIADVSENELEIWYGPQDRMIVQVKPPGADKWITVRPREFIENRRLANGTMLSVYNELYHPTNGSNYIAIYLSPYLDPRAPRGVAAGIWTIRLTGEEIRDGRFHCWIERDDPFELDRVGQVRVFRFPSFFTERSNVDSHQINSLACGFRVIGVANADTRAQTINKTSSQGPTRDGRLKPDIAAPGTDIVAARGFGPPGEPWIPMTGTSMASPYVCGVVGLMLAANPKLTSAQCQGILQRTCRPLPSHSYDWRNDAGFGLIDPEAAIKEAKSFDLRVDKT
jgi:subtilisin family serine protease